jgi:hypothetical protein
VNGPGATDVKATKAPSTEELARQLVARASRGSSTNGSSALTAFLACELTYRALARSIGVAGAHALFARAKSQTVKSHPLLREIHIEHRDDGDRSGIDAVIAKHGGAASAAALEAVLEVLLNLLGRFVGIDLVVRLVAQGATIGTNEHEDMP